MYFTDTPELRKFEREMKQKPNFDRRNDYFSNNESSRKRKDIKSDDNKKFNNGGQTYENKNQKSYLNSTRLRIQLWR